MTTIPKTPAIRAVSDPYGTTRDVSPSSSQGSRDFEVGEGVRVRVLNSPFCLNGERFAHQFPARFSRRPAPSEATDVGKIRAILLNREKPVMDYMVIQELVQKLKATESREAAQVLVEFLGTNRGPLLMPAVEALVKMEVPPAIKVAGLRKLVENDASLLPTAIEFLKKIAGPEADQFLAEMADPKSPYPKHIRIEAEREIKKREKNASLIKISQGDVRLNPEDPKALYLLGVAFYGNHETEKAMAAFHKAIQLRENYSEAYYFMGECYLEKENYSEARKYYQRVSREHRLYPQAQKKIKEIEVLRR